jgi:hypothetical protein
MQPPRETSTGLPVVKANDPSCPSLAHLPCAVEGGFPPAVGSDRKMGLQRRLTGKVPVHVVNQAWRARGGWLSDNLWSQPELSSLLLKLCCDELGSIPTGLLRESPIVDPGWA